MLREKEEMWASEGRPCTLNAPETSVLIASSDAPSIGRALFAERFSPLPALTDQHSRRTIFIVV